MRSFSLLLLLIPTLCSASPSRDSLPPSDYFTVRNGLPQTFHAITVQKSVTVAFLGGSITYNPGWRELTCAWLRETFPGTHFHFIAAGIPSLGSLPHAFRLQRDVLDSGKVDMLFVETAVNDRVNGTDSLTQLRALEGIVRHAKRSNPSMDMIFLSFADPTKTLDYDQGKIPPEVANHERVAGYYGFPSINLAKEVHDKLAHGEFSWEKDFKDVHPSPFGQALYFTAIKDLLDTCLVGSRMGHLAGSTLPAALDNASLTSGYYYTIKKAKHDKSWEYDAAWQPKDSLATRPGFVNVPMLVATTPGATLTLPFKGRAIGMAVISGGDAGIISWSVDDGPVKKTDLYTAWSSFLHLPWYVLFSAELTDGRHVLRLTVDETKNPNSKGTACRIVHFLVNR